MQHAATLFSGLQELDSTQLTTAPAKKLNTIGSRLLSPTRWLQLRTIATPY